MYCGDEASGVVVDIGSQSARFGFAGSSAPTVHLPSDIGYQPGEGDAAKWVMSPSVHTAHAGREIRNPMKKGLVDDWDSLEKLWEHAIEELRIEPGDRPFLVAENPLSVQPQRERMAELLFEKLGCKAVFLAKSSVLGAFSAGLATACVVDMGASHTRISPVFDGYQLNGAVQQTDIAGAKLVRAVGAHVEKLAGKPLRPLYAARGDPAAPPTASFHDYSWMSTAEDAMRSWCGVSPLAFRPGILAEEMHDLAEEEEYELPDGTKVTVKDERAAIPEWLFHQRPSNYCESFPAQLAPAVPLAEAQPAEPDHAAAAAGGTTPAQQEAGMDGLRRPTCKYDLLQRMRYARVYSTVGQSHGSVVAPVALPRMVQHAITSADADVRKELCNNILLTGGLSLMEGLGGRLQADLEPVIPSAFRPRVVRGTRHERRYAHWLGGSVLAALGTFQQMWVSKVEYDDEGASAVERRCA